MKRSLFRTSVFLHIALLLMLPPLLAYRFHTGLFLAVGVALLLGISLATIMLSQRSLARRMERLAHISSQVARGESASSLLPEDTDEVGSLEESLGRMAHALNQRMEEVSREKALLEGVLKGMAEGVIVLGERGEVVMVNRAASSLFGLAENVLSRPFVEVVRVPGILKLVADAEASGNATGGEVELLAPVRRNLLLSCVPLRETGAGGIVLVSHDVTAEKKAQRMKEDFIANVSHELKTPVAALKGFAETLLDGAVEDTPTARRFLTIILAQSDRLGRLVNDLLALSRIEMGEQNITPVSVNLAEVAAGVVTVLEGKAAEKKVGLRSSVPDGLSVSADRDALSQVLLNLADNAVKFGSEGGCVEIRAEVSAGCPGGRVEISVVDDGPGIPPQHLPRLGERFYRVDASRSRELGGTGLGLAIVKHLIMAHGSELRVTSEVRKGTAFSFTLPVVS